MPKTVVVIGAGIAGLTAAFRLQEKGFQVLVLEATDHVGGRMSTDRHQGFIIDRGAQFLSNGYTILTQLLRDVNLLDKIVSIKPWMGIVRTGKVRRVNPRLPWTIATSGLLDWYHTLRLGFRSLNMLRATRSCSLSDYSSWSHWDDQDAAQWIKAEFGSDVLEYIFEPMLEGLYFQVPEGMSRTLPMVVYNYGARFKNMIALANGIGSLPEALASKVPVYLSSYVTELNRVGSIVEVRTHSNTIQADYVVLATTASVAKKLYSSHDTVEQHLLATPYSCTINISVVLEKRISTPHVAPDIYGLLIPRQERRVIASIGIESRKHPHYVSEGDILNVMLDGKAGARLIEAPENNILSEILPELNQYFPGIEKKIKFMRYHRWPEAEPLSPIGRSHHIHTYRQRIAPDTKVILAGDYMSTPTTEGAAESGAWAANLLSTLEKLDQVRF